jgi:hypothetical protein
LFNRFFAFVIGKETLRVFITPLQLYYATSEIGQGAEFGQNADRTLALPTKLFCI